MGKKLNALLTCFLIVALCTCNEIEAVETKIKVAFCSNYPPYQFVDENNVCVGLHIDIIDEIARLKNLTVEYIPMENESDCLDAMDLQVVDMVLGISVDKYPRYILQSSDEISSSNISLFVPGYIAKRLEINSSLNEYVASTQYMVGNSSVMMNLGVCQRISVGNLATLFETQRKGMSDIMVGDRNSLQFQITRAGMENQYVIYSNYVGTVRYNVLVKKGDQELLRTINSSLAQMRTNGKYDVLSKQWLIAEKTYSWKVIIKEILTVATIFTAIAALYIVIEVRTRKRLKMQVLEKTREIQETNDELGKRILQIEDESELRNLLIQNSPNGMVLFNRDYIVTLMNRNALQIAGIREMPLHTSIFNIPILGQILHDIDADIFKNDGKLHNCVITLTGRNNAQSIFKNSLHPVINLGQVTGAILSVEDITQAEANKNAMFEKEKNQALSRMVAGIAHEIRNPLMSIRTFATMSKTRGSDHQFLDAFAEIVPSEVDRINKLVEGLINYARPARGQKVEIALFQMVEECLYLTKSVATAGKICVSIDGERDLRVRANPDQLKQVLINIIMNSIESMECKIEKHGKMPLHLTLAIIGPDNGKASIVIQDEGSGMTADILGQCTDPFFTTKTSGTGLGLALCRQYMQENGGSLTIDSVEGIFTKVTLILKAIDSLA